MTEKVHCLQCRKDMSGMQQINRRKFCGNACVNAYRHAKGPGLFWEKVKKTDSCWLYMGFRKWDGYGWLARHLDGRNRYLTAHRYAWMLTNGPVEAGKQVLHKCDNPPCCNPAHLFIGTHSDNHADKIKKHRHCYGERTKRNKLTFDKAMEIRRRRAAGETLFSLAQAFGVRTNHISGVCNGRYWNGPGPSESLHPGRVRPRRAA